jgi:hypothetical protein
MKRRPEERLLQLAESSIAVVAAVGIAAATPAATSAIAAKRIAAVIAAPARAAAVINANADFNNMALAPSLNDAAGRMVKSQCKIGK